MLSLQDMYKPPNMASFQDILITDIPTSSDIEGLHIVWFLHRMLQPVYNILCRNNLQWTPPVLALGELVKTVVL